MKVFRVIYERDGKTTKVHGETSTEIIRTELRYGAEKIEQVWKSIEWIRNNERWTLIAVHEEHPAIVIL